MPSFACIEFQKLGPWELLRTEANLECISRVGCPARDAVEETIWKLLERLFEISIAEVVLGSNNLAESTTLSKIGNRCTLEG